MKAFSEKRKPIIPTNNRHSHVLAGFQTITSSAGGMLDSSYAQGL